MISAGASEEQVEAVATVLRDAGFEGECAAELGAQGGGIEAVMLDIAPKAFPFGLVGAAGADAWKRVKRLMRELREASASPGRPRSALPPARRDHQGGVRTQRPQGGPARVPPGSREPSRRPARHHADVG